METALSLPLIAARTVHFASTVMIAGTILFLFLIEAPVVKRLGDRTQPIFTSLHKRLVRIAWWCLAVSIVSGVAWLLVLAAKISGSSLREVISDGAARTFLTQTQFGHDWEVRFVLAVLLAVALLRFRSTDGWHSAEGFLAAALAMGFLGSLAWSGHGGATPGLRGGVHVTADAFHLIAAGAWIGGVFPLALLLSSAEKMTGAVGINIARDAALRFSTLGIVAVGTLVITGVVNTWVLVGSISALIEFQYGRMLLLKIAIFLVLLVVAAVNRTRLTPRLATPTAGGSRSSMDALRRLKQSCVIETALGIGVLILVGALGTISPGMDMPE